MNDIPDEIVEYICSFFTPFTLNKFSLVNKRFNKATKIQMRKIKFIMERMLRNITINIFSFQDLLGLYRKGHIVPIDKIKLNDYYLGKNIQFIYFFNFNNMFSRRIDIVDGKLIGVIKNKNIIRVRVNNRYSAYKWHNIFYLPTDKWNFRKNEVDCNSSWSTEYILPKSLRIIY